MKQENAVRLSVVSIALTLVAGSFVVGCSSDDAASSTTDPPANGVDSGKPATDGGSPATDSGTTPATDSGTTPPTDGGAAATDSGARDGGAAPDATVGPDGGVAPTDGGTAPTDSGAAVDAGSPTGIIIDIVHASPDTAQVGLCIGAVVGGNTAFPAPFNVVQGPLPRNAATQITVPSALQGAIGGVVVKVFAIPGYNKLADGGAPLCASYFGDGGTPGAVLLKEFPAQTFKTGKGYIIAATGCSNPGAGTVAKCGADPTTPANPRGLTTYFKEFDRTFIGTGDIGAQFVHLSSQTEGLTPFANGVKVAVGLDGNPPTWAAWASGANAVKFAADPTTKVTAPSPADPNTLALGLFTAAASGSPTGQTAVAAIPFSAVALASTGAANPTYFKKGITYTFFAVGDATQTPPGGTNPGADFLRVLALPNNP